MAQYTERPDDYVQEPRSSGRKFDTARTLVPRPVVEDRTTGGTVGIIAFGSSHWAVQESRDQLREEAGLKTSYLRLRAYPFTPEVDDFIRRHDRVYVVEQNRDAQMLSLLLMDGEAAARDAPAQRAALQRSADRRAQHHGRAFCNRNERIVGAGLHASPPGIHSDTSTHSRTETHQPHQPRRVASYRGSKTTLCAGCGHNAISERIIDAFFEMGVDPKRVVKLSGIGCSSKSPAYFLNPSHGFNSVHGRMPSVATGAMLANRSMLAIGVSGDGDTGAIGIGQFVHLMRRNLPLIYIIEDNGCYGLTKGQFSPTADLGSKAKNGVVNDLPPIDTCALAIELGASFVARSFSGDKKQLLSVLKAAISHRGTSMIDVISPCVTFNDHDGSTKSYSYVKDHDEPLGEISFVPFFEDITVEYEPGIDDGREDARRLAAVPAQGRRGLQPVGQDRRDAAAARDRAPRRVRDRHPLHRAGQGRLHRHAEPRRRAAGVAADGAHAPAAAALDEIMESLR